MSTPYAVRFARFEDSNDKFHVVITAPYNDHIKHINLKWNYAVTDHRGNLVEVGTCKAKLTDYKKAFRHAFEETDKSMSLLFPQGY